MVMCCAVCPVPATYAQHVSCLGYLLAAGQLHVCCAPEARRSGLFLRFLVLILVVQRCTQNECWPYLLNRIIYATYTYTYSN
jgi:hypothetical protein